MWRLETLTISGFRGITTTQALDFDADVVVMVGENGFGKTSVLDASLWCLAGAVPRVGDDAALRSVYATDDPMDVTVSLRNQQRRAVVRRRRGEGGASLTLAFPEDDVPKPVRDDELRKALWPQQSDVTGNEAMAARFTSWLYLEQERLAEFVMRSDDRARYEIVAGMLGVGRIVDLQNHLDTAKQQWAGATTRFRDADVATSRARLHRLETELRELAGATPVAVDELSAEWQDWWSNAAAAGVEAEVVPLNAPTASVAIDTALRQLDALRAAAERRDAELVSLQSQLGDEEAANWFSEASPDSGVDEQRQALERDRERLAVLESELARAAAEFASQRSASIEQQDRLSDLQLLAQVALRHLGEQCPVCTQAYDMAATRERLTGLLSAPPIEPPSRTAVDQREREVNELRRTVAQREDEIARRERRARSDELARTEIRGRLIASGIEAPELNAARASVTEQRGALSTRLTLISGLRDQGATLALRHGYVAQEVRAEEVRTEIARARQAYETAENNLRLREETAARASVALTLIRESQDEYVNRRLQQLLPVLKSVYASIDPHPTFRDVALLPRFEYRRGRLELVVTDPMRETGPQSPRVVLSASQTNALAVSLFLSLNLALPAPMLDAVILDDPLQSLDRVHLLGMVDVLRRTTPYRQVVVATHDTSLGQLIARKLRPIGMEHRTVMIRMAGWDPSGPTVVQQEITHDTAGLRLVG